MASNPFNTHHAAAGKAFASGNHAKAMHHIGHMMMAVHHAKRGIGSSATTGAPEGPTAEQSESAAVAGSDDDIREDMNPMGVSTPAPNPAKQHFFGQVAKPNPPSRPAAPKPSFNKARFAGMKSH